MSRLIKKYKNRRLYDTEISRYITVEELQDYVINDIAFIVLDASDGKDLTNTVLLQILVESQSTTSALLSPVLLRELIKIMHHPMQRSYMAVLEQVLTNIANASEDNTYFSDYQKMSELWVRQMEQFFKK